MTRDIDPATSSVLESPNVPWVLLLELFFDNGTLYLNSGITNFEFESNIYLGIGAIGQISGVVEKAEGGDNRINCILSPIPSTDLADLVDEVTNEDPVGRPFILRYVVLDDAGSIVGDPIVMSSGTIDEINLENGETAGLSMNLVNDAARLQQRTVFKYTNEHQQQLFTGDLGCATVDNLGDEILWGSSQKTQIGNGSGGSGGGGGTDTGGGSVFDPEGRLRA